MTVNLLLWRWSADYDTPAKRKKRGLKFGDVTRQFAATGDHPAIAETDLSEFRNLIEAEFGPEDHRPFVLENYRKCAVANMPNAHRIQLIPKIADLGRRFGLNAAEF